MTTAARRAPALATVHALPVAPPDPDGTILRAQSDPMAAAGGITILGGSLVTEVVFNYPGLGQILYLGIVTRDYPLIQGQLLMTTFATLLANLAVDLLYVLLDPRLRKA